MTSKCSITLRFASTARRTFLAWFQSELAGAKTSTDRWNQPTYRALYLQFRGLDLLGINEEGVPGRPCCLEAMSLRVRSAPRPLRLCRGVSEAASLHPQGW